MGLNCRIGGARGMFEAGLATEVAGVLGQAFGADGDWEVAESRGYGELDEANWADFRDRAADEFGADEVPNILALGVEGRVVYLPASVRAMTLGLSSGQLRCASLPGLRSELLALADRWELPVDDHALEEFLRGGEDPDDGPVADAPEVLAFARLTLAANEAMRRDCPLWLAV